MRGRKAGGKGAERRPGRGHGAAVPGPDGPVRDRRLRPRPCACRSTQLHLLDRLAGAGKDVVVVLAGGSPVETPWLPRAKAVLYTALGGEGVGEAVFQLLYGRACPAGRLAETWPKRLEDTPAARHWPMGPDAVTYNESIYVGYRYYDKAHVDVRFPSATG
ncbi:MAG: glycoside hydrolase family 3 protein [Ruthenibacterium lactatiformans]